MSMPTDTELNEALKKIEESTEMGGAGPGPAVSVTSKDDRNHTVKSNKKDGSTDAPKEYERDDEVKSTENKRDAGAEEAQKEYLLLIQSK